ncbi:hypothetical protein AGMMS49975_13060 [Clostridia bacterium]|nr:hypothetical protein AGMMS49975_13060 [Clostridia bacterium]
MKKRMVVVSVFIIGFFAVVSWNYAKPYKRYLIEEASLQKDLDRATEEFQRIQEEKKYQGTDAYIEKVAREKFGYVLPNEYVIYNSTE